MIYHKFIALKACKVNVQRNYNVRPKQLVLLHCYLTINYL